MLSLNLQNIEKLVFFDKKIQRQLPEFRTLFDQWAISKHVSALKNMGTKALIDLLNSLKSEHIIVLEKYFNEQITIDKTDRHVVYNQTIPLGMAADRLNEFDWNQNFCISRDRDQLYICYWR